MNKSGLFSVDKYFNVLMKSCLIIVVIFILVLTIRTNQISDRVSRENLEEVNIQINILIDSTFSQIKLTSQYIAFSQSTSDYLLCQDDFKLITMKQHLDNVIRPLVDTNNHLYNIILYRADQRIPYFAKVQSINPKLFYDMETVFEDREHQYEGFATLSQDDKSDSYYPVYVTKVTKVGYGKDCGSFIGTLVIALKPDFLNQVINSVSSQNIASILIANNKDEIIASSSAVNDADYEELRKSPGIYTQNIMGTDWKLVCVMKRSFIARTFHSFFLILMTLSILFIIMLIVIYLCLGKNITSPISALCKEIIDIIPLDGDQRISSCKVLEINNIVESINTLLEQRHLNTQKILELRKRQYEIKLNKKSSDLMALKSQVNPHFLYNTFTCIGGIALTYNVPGIAVIISNMSEICRYSLAKADIVTVRQEISITKKYFEIADIRFEHAYQMEIDVLDSIMDCRIPKMILQPLVENALYHGLEPLNSGKILVTGRCRDHKIVFIVSDNGIGIPPAALKEQQELLEDTSKLEYSSVYEGRIGNVNLCRRIKLLYGETHGIKIDSKQGEGTRVVLTLPLSQAGNPIYF